MPTVVSTPRVVATPVTAAATLVGGRHYPANATNGAFTLTLPTGQAQGVEISVEKTDTTGNAVTLSGSIRGTASTLPLVLQRETVLLMSDAAGSWWPVAAPPTSTAVGRAVQTAVDQQAARTAIGAGTSNLALGTSTTTAPANPPAGVYVWVLFPYTDATVARPTVAANVRLNWTGPAGVGGAAPTNMATNDTWDLVS